MLMQLLKNRVKNAWHLLCERLKARFAATPNKWDDALGEIFLKDEHFELFWSLVTGEAPPPDQTHVTCPPSE